MFLKSSHKLHLLIKCVFSLASKTQNIPPQKVKPTPEKWC